MKSDAHKHGFSVHCPNHKKGKTMFFAALDDQDRSLWKEAIIEASKPPPKVDRTASKIPSFKIQCS